MRLLAAVLALIAIAVTASPIQESNGQRMARGLPPLPPKLGRNLPGYVEARDPTPAAAAKRSQTSPSPSVSYSGRINVRTSEGSSLGYVRNSPATWTIGGVNFLGPEQDLHVSFTTTASGIGPFDILATDPAFPAPFYVGAGGTSTIGLNSPKTVDFTNVEQTPPNSIGGVVESAIWSINPTTNELTAQYVNPDGTKPNTVIAYDIRANELFFVGDLVAYNVPNADTPASAVTFVLTP
jgi:hypothetical protein